MHHLLCVAKGFCFAKGFCAHCGGFHSCLGACRQALGGNLLGKSFSGQHLPLGPDVHARSLQPVPSSGAALCRASAWSPAWRPPPAVDGSSGSGHGAGRCARRVSELPAGGGCPGTLSEVGTRACGGPGMWGHITSCVLVSLEATGGLEPRGSVIWSTVTLVLRQKVTCHVGVCESKVL